MNNPYIVQQRAQFANDLADPTTHDQVCAMMITEDGANPVPCLESLLNRILYCNSQGQTRTILSMLHSGFYGPYNRGMYPRTISELHASAALQARMNAAIATVMAGSDLIHGFTDQGLPTDPNGQRQPQMRLGGNIFNDWGGGPGGHDGAEAWRQTFETSALQTALNVLGCTPALAVDGKPSDALTAAVKGFQMQHPPLVVDGDVGPPYATWAAINAELAAASGAVS
jgi:hypothetical protein